MTITDPGHGPRADEAGTTSRTKRRSGSRFAGSRSWRAGASGSMDFTARVGAACAALCAVLYLGCMTHTLADHRDWVGVAAFVVALVFAALALLTAAPYVIRGDRPAVLLPRATMWGTGIVLATLQLIAAVLGDAEFSMVAVIGITAALAVPCFGELAAQPARGPRSGRVPGEGHRTPASAAPGAATAAEPAAPAPTADSETVSVPAPGSRPAAGTSGIRGNAHPPAGNPVETAGPAVPAAPAASEPGVVPPPPQERPVADRLRKSDRLRKE
ncbi:hypothetical protein [Streptomyces meridianus]|uniref:Integral membrane protein n=1 Tax=Streptomyces meridianus TaxID=2938945 RepID=A0ABT0XA53_9ACTN|nr:hypothetical protein [Streptomyces meridianus]MCM2579284.1 hypothetical protein [Streptomyces meridianus]